MPAPGEAIRIEMTKWGQRPHWQLSGIFLGSDEHGDWTGHPAGTHCSRPGASFDTAVASVTLVPRSGGHCPTFYEPGIWASIYVDITTPPRWDGSVMRAVDLDLDVVRTGEGRIYVDDEDEFAEHQVRYGYPHDVIAAAEQECALVLAEMRAGRAPYDPATSRRWLDLLATQS